MKYGFSVREICFSRRLRKMILLRRVNGVGGIIKTVGTFSIDVLDSKYVFGISAPPGEN